MSTPTIIPVTPGSGINLDAVSLVIGLNTVVRETMVIADPSNGTYLATVNSAGALNVSDAAIEACITANVLAVSLPTAQISTLTPPSASAIAAAIVANPPATFNGVVTNAGTFAVQASQSGTWNVSNFGTFAVQAAQSGTWNVGLNAGSSLIGQVEVTDGTNILFASGHAGYVQFPSAQPVTLTSTTITGSVAVTQSTSPWVVTGTDADNAANSTTKLPVLAARANASAPSWTEGHEVPLSTDLAGNLRVSITGSITANNNITQWNSVAVGSPTAFGTEPSGNVIGVNAEVFQGATVVGSGNPLYTQFASAQPVTLASTTITGTVAVTQSTSPWIVAGGGTAGTPGTAVLTVQGISGGTAVPISGTVTITPSGLQNVNLTQLNSVALGSPSNYGTSPGTVAVQGVNAFITNTPAVTLASTTITGTVAVTQSTSPWVVSNSGTFAVQAAQSGTWTVGISAAQTIAVTNAGTFAVQAAQSGAWNVNQTLGTPGYEAITDGTTGPVAVKAASTSSVATDKSLVVQISPNQPNLTTPLNVAVSSGTITATGNITQWDSTALGAPTAFGTAPSGNVIGTNAELFVGTNAVSATAPVPVSATAAANASGNPIFVETVTGSTTAVTGTVTTSPGGTTDYAPATQTITARDTASTLTAYGSQVFITGTATANSTANFAVSAGYDSALIQCTSSSSSAVLSVEGSLDGGVTWVYLPTYRIGDISGLSTANVPTGNGTTHPIYISQNFIGVVNLAGFTNFRIRAAITPTTVTVRVIFTNNSAIHYAGNSTLVCGITNSGSTPVTPPVYIAGYDPTNGIEPLYLNAFGTAPTTLAEALAVNADLFAGQTALVADGSGNLQVNIAAQSLNPIVVSGTIASITNPVTVVGDAANGAAVAGNPVLIAGSDGTDARSLLTSATGQLHVIQDTGSTTAVTGVVEVSPTTAANTASNPFFNSIVASSNTAAVKAASTAAVATDPALVVAISPNNTVPVSLASTTITGTVAVTQSTSPWVVSNGGTFAVQAAQSGNWTSRIVGNAGATLDAATGAAAPTNTLQVGGSDGTDIRVLLASATGQLHVLADTGSTTAVTQATAANLNATVVGSGVFEVSPTTAANTNSNPFFNSITDGTTKVTVIAATAALKTDLSSVAGTATSTAASGTQKVGITGSAAGVLDAVITAATAPANALATLSVNNTAPPSLTTGQSVALQSDYEGSLFVKPYRRGQTTSKATTIAATTSATTILAAQASGIFADISSLIVTATPGSTGTAFTVTLSDGTNSYIFDMDTGSTTTLVQNGILNLSFNPPLPASSTATAWTLANSSATPTIHVTCVAVLQKAS